MQRYMSPSKCFNNIHTQLPVHPISTDIHIRVEADHSRVSAPLCPQVFRYRHRVLRCFCLRLSLRPCILSQVDNSVRHKLSHRPCCSTLSLMLSIQAVGVSLNVHLLYSIKLTLRNRRHSQHRQQQPRFTPTFLTIVRYIFCTSVSPLSASLVAP